MRTAWGESTFIPAFGNNIKFPYPAPYFALLKPLTEIGFYSLLKILHLFENLWEKLNTLDEMKRNKSVAWKLAIYVHFQIQKSN